MDSVFPTNITSEKLFADGIDKELFKSHID